MNNYNNPNVTREKAIEILLFQYESLRQEELTSMSNGVNMASIALGTLGAVFGIIQQTGANEIFLFIPPGLTVFFLLYIIQQWVVFYIGRYLKVIEGLVNELAGTDILLWETLFAGAMIQGKVLLKHQNNSSRAINYYPIAASIILVILGISYGFSVIASIGIILDNNPTETYLAVLWGFLFIFSIVAIAIARLFLLPKFLDAAESHFRDALKPIIDEVTEKRIDIIVASHISTEESP